MRDGQQFLQLAPWLVVFPCLAIALLSIATVLAGEHPIDEVLQRDLEGAPKELTVLTCGRIPEHPAELLVSPPAPVDVDSVPVDGPPEDAVVVSPDPEPPSPPSLPRAETGSGASIAGAAPDTALVPSSAHTPAPLHTFNCSRIGLAPVRRRGARPRERWLLSEAHRRKCN